MATLLRFKNTFPQLNSYGLIKDYDNYTLL